jgi:hypothetical protein
MKYREAFPIIYSADVRAALAFYRDALGFGETFRFPPDGEPEFVALTLDDSSAVALAAAAAKPCMACHCGRAGMASSCASTPTTSTRRWATCDRMGTTCCSSRWTSHGTNAWRTSQIPTETPS